jgi:2-polyprenyl-3-methyl-5-hydroxy-6-metoxy-1,4-benzoquinol methylase
MSLMDISVDSSAPVPEKPTGYYSNSRAELIPLIPISATRILEIGCAEGAFAKSLCAVRKGFRPEIIGVEINPSAALKAEQVLNAVFVGNIEQLELPFRDHFDCVVCADVLEHLVDPWKTLERLKAYLRPGGYVVSSIPNIQHWREVVNLLGGSWEYTKEGIMDSTHLRFFTRKSIVNFFERSEFNVELLRSHVPTPRGRFLNSITGTLLEPFLTFQYHIVAKDHRTAARK